MKNRYKIKALLYVCHLLCASQLFAQSAVVKSITHGGGKRDYRLYVPTIYQPGKAAPLILDLHGYGSNAAQQEAYSNFMPIADTAGFILVHPEGSGSPKGWNYYISGGTDDAGFLSALIDSIKKDYNVDLNRVYSTGISNGGFMSNYLACYTSRIAAIAPVSGTMLKTQLNTCSPSHPTPAVVIHGTSDNVVAYNGAATFASVEDVVNHWVGFNQASASPVLTQLPNSSTSDNCTAERYIYNGNSCNSVELYKIIGGGHTWPGGVGPGVGGNTNRDFSASKEIWRFFSQCRLNTTGITASLIAEADVNVFPNPARSGFEIRVSGQQQGPCTVHIYNVLSQEVVQAGMEGTSIHISRGNLPAGIYHVHLSNGHSTFIRKVVFNEAP